MPDSLTQELCELVADVMGVAPADISLSSSPDTVEDWDSIKQLSLAVAIEERFGVALEPEQIESFTDVASLLAIVEKARK